MNQPPFPPPPPGAISRPAYGSSQRSLRILIVTSIGLCVLTCLISSVQGNYLPPLLLEYKQSVVITQSSEILAVSCLVLLIISYVLLWRGVAMGRAMYTTAVIALLLSEIINEPTVDIGINAMVEDACTICWGIMLGVLYFSDLKFLYGAKRSFP